MPFYITLKSKLMYADSVSTLSYSNADPLKNGMD